MVRPYNDRAIVGVVRGQSRPAGAYGCPRPCTEWREVKPFIRGVARFMPPMSIAQFLVVLSTKGAAYYSLGQSEGLSGRASPQVGDCTET